MNKSGLVDALRAEQRRWQAFLDEFGSTRMDQAGLAGEWSMKDVVAHLTAWNRSLVDRLGAAQRGEPEPPTPWPAHLENEDAINAWIYEANRGRMAREVLDESQQVFEQLLAVIEALPDDVRIEQVHHEGNVYLFVWLGDTRFPAGEFFDHFRDDHEPGIRAWMARAQQG